jgi:hypothetical protein
MNNEPVAWTVCLDCGKRVTGDSIHTCSPQLKTITDEEILQQALFSFGNESENFDDSYWIGFARAILKKASEK